MRPYRVKAERRLGPPHGDVVLESEYLRVLKDIANEHEKQMARQIADGLRQCGVPTGLVILAALGLFLEERL